MKSTQLTTLDGKPAKYSVTEYCEIDSIYEIEGNKVYRAIYTIEEEKKRFHVLLGLDNLEIISFRTIRNNREDTLDFGFHLLDFPLYQEKTWQSDESYQEDVDKPTLKVEAKYHIAEIRDTNLTLNNQAIKTKAWVIKSSLLFEEQRFTSGFTYFAPTKLYPGSCPIFLWTEMMQNLSEEGKSKHRKYKRELIEFEW